MKSSTISKIANFRRMAQDTPELLNKRQKFLDLLYLIVKDTSDVQTCEMYNIDNEKGEKVKTKWWTTPQYPHEFKLHNTRKKIKSETCCEIDKLEFEKAMEIIFEVVASLMRKNIHFAIFYAQGQRSPHIRIYDFEELNELNPLGRIKAQVQFWRNHVPFGTFQYVDTGMFQDEKTYQLEFSGHWKYGTTFNLVFEYPFMEEKCNT